MKRLANKRKVEKIYTILQRDFGGFHSKSIGHSYLEKNKSFLIQTKNDKYVLKIKNISENPQKEILQEVKARDSLKKIFTKANIKNYVITEIEKYDLNNFWILAKYVEFEALYPIFKRDKNRFRKIIIEFYKTIIIPLDDRINPGTPINVDFGLNDLGYHNGKFYFFDFEPQKKIGQMIVDTYARLIHVYLLRLNQNRPRLANFIEKLIFEVKQIQAGHINNKIFNNYLRIRLKSPTLREQLEEKDFERIYKKFKY